MTQPELSSGLPVLPKQAASPAKLNQLLQLAQRGTEIADMAKITGLPAPLVEATLEATPLTNDLKELIPDADNYADLNLAVRAAKHKRQLKHEDKASDIYALVLQRTEESLLNGGTHSLRSLLEGIRVLQPQAALRTATHRADEAQLNVQNNIRTVNISLQGLTQSSRPILDDRGNILGISDDNGDVVELVNMDVTTLRNRAGTSNASTVNPAVSMRQLLNQSAALLECDPTEESLEAELNNLQPKNGD